MLLIIKWIFSVTFIIFTWISRNLTHNLGKIWEKRELLIYMILKWAKDNFKEGYTIGYKELWKILIRGKVFGVEF